MKLREKGFSLIELVTVVAIFMMITGVVFLLLNASQQRYQMESSFLNEFQTARLAIDQMSRDIHGAGYPPLNSYMSNVALSSNAQTAVLAVPFAWSGNSYWTYDPLTPTATAACTVGSCSPVPSSYDLIVEGNISPTSGSGVQWIRYKLIGTTLYRGVAAKTAGTDPDTATTASGVLQLYVENVMNNASSTQMSAISAAYPGLFPNNTAVPIFTYFCDNGSSVPTACTSSSVSAPYNTAPYIRQVGITLIMQASQLDPKTGQPRIASLHTEAWVLNPQQ